MTYVLSVPVVQCCGLRTPPVTWFGEINQIWNLNLYNLLLRCWLLVTFRFFQLQKFKCPFVCLRSQSVTSLLPSYRLLPLNLPLSLKSIKIKYPKLKTKLALWASFITICQSSSQELPVQCLLFSKGSAVRCEIGKQFPKHYILKWHMTSQLG